MADKNSSNPHAARPHPAPKLPSPPSSPASAASNVRRSGPPEVEKPGAGPVWGTNRRSEKPPWLDQSSAPFGKIIIPESLNCSPVRWVPHGDGSIPTTWDRYMKASVVCILVETIHQLTSQTSSGAGALSNHGTGDSYIFAIPFT
jgi:hypothetical protein